ncbi:MAG: flagellin [Alphaproteobacteria bacterium]|nr:flagellin [Alphaproteobacteria bacterium]
MSLLTNTSAMIALQNLRTVNAGLATVQEQISTGKKVGSARDNAAIFAISTVMQSDVQGFKAISSSLNLGSSTVAVARGAAEQITELLTEMKGLIVAAQEENVDRTKIQTDVGQLRNQITSIVDAAQFNGLNLLKSGANVNILASLNRDSSGTVTAAPISIARVSLETVAGVAVAGLAASTTGVNGGGDSAAQLVADTNVFALDIDNGATFTAGDIYEVKIDGRRFNYEVQTGDDLNDVGQGITNLINNAGLTGITVAFSTGVASTTDAQVDITNASGSTVAIEVGVTDGSGGGLGALNALNVSTGAGASAALVSIEGLIQTAVDAAAEFGSAQKRIDIQTTFISNLTDALKTGIGALVDADLEEASARLQSLQVQQQLGIQALSIANQAPNAILGLFR